jgi:hypothetical protein
MNVMFLDEATVRLVNSRAVTVRRPKTISRYKSRFTDPTVNHLVGVMVWGCYSGKVGREASTICPGT